MADYSLPNLAFRPLRQRARGAIRLDMTMMILTLVAGAGLSTWALIEHDAWKKDKEYVERAHLAAQRPGLALNAAENAAKRLSAVIGYNGGSGLTNIGLLENHISQLRNTKFVLHSFQADAVIGGEDATKSVLRRSGNGFAGVTRKEAESYLPNQTDLKLQDVFGFQNKSVLDHVELLKTWNRARTAERQYVAASAQAASAAKSATLNTTKEAMASNVSSVNTARSEATDAMGRAEGGQKEASVKAGQLLDDIRVAHENLRARMVENEKHRFSAAEERERFLKLLSDRITTRAGANESVGAILQVDPEDRWVWINLGQADNVRPEMSFFVFRRSDDGENDRQIAEVQVKEVLDARFSLCRIITTASNDILPAVGDSLRKPNFSSRMYTRYAFVGKFGSGMTTYTRDQLTEKLRDMGFVVQASPDATTEVLILGGGFLDDPEFQRISASDPPIVVERMTEEEILYMLGLIGPVANR